MQRFAIEPANQGALTARDWLRIKQAATAPLAKPDNNKNHGRRQAT